MGDIKSGYIVFEFLHGAPVMFFSISGYLIINYRSVFPECIDFFKK